MRPDDTAIRPVHAIPGRIRLRVPLRDKASVWRGRLAQEASDLLGVRWIRMNIKCGSLIVRFDPDIVTAAAITAHLGKLMRDARETGASIPHSTTSRSKALSRIRPLHAAGRRFVFLSLLMAGVVIRRIFLGLSVSQRHIASSASFQGSSSRPPS